MASRDRVVVVVYPHVTIQVPGVGLVPEIGHAGVLLINGTSGLTKYFEYGRYNNIQLGIVLNKVVPNVTMDPAGEPTLASFKAVLRSLSLQSGKMTTVEVVSYLAEDAFAAGLAYCQGRLALNNDPNRTPYSVVTNNCVSFADSTAKTMVSAWSVLNMPVFNPVPHTYILGAQLASLLLPDAHKYSYEYTTDSIV